MSMVRLQQIAARTDLSASEFVVAIKLAYHENSQTGECFPSIRSLERETGLSHPTILKVLKAIEDKKIVTKTIKLDAKKNPHSHYKFVDPVGNYSTHPVGKEITHPVGSLITQGGSTDYPRVGNEATSNKEYESRNESGTPPTVYTVTTVADTASTVGTVVGGDEVKNAAKEYPEKKDDATDQDPQNPKISHPGLKWMQRFEPYSDVFDILFSENHSCFVTAYDPVLGIDGNTLAPSQVAAIEDDPINSALAVIREAKNGVTRKALASRISWIGKDYFVGEIVRMASEVKDGTIKCKHLGKTLLRRLDYCYSFSIATDGFTREFDLKRLWDYALGVNSIAA